MPAYEGFFKDKHNINLTLSFEKIGSAALALCISPYLS